VKDTPITADEVIQVLKTEQYISIQGSGVEYLQKNDRPVYYSPRTDSWGWSSRAPRDEILDRCRSWIVHPNNKPTTSVALGKCLEQLCIVKKQMDVQEILNCLRELNLVEVQDDDTLLYKF
jgi:hypothetical protein